MIQIASHHIAINEVYQVSEFLVGFSFSAHIPAENKKGLVCYYTNETFRSSVGGQMTDIVLVFIFFQTFSRVYRVIFNAFEKNY